jgi:hypothetical protein
MTNTTISIPVDVSTAIAYSQASLEQQSNVSLQQIMDDIGAQAEARGLTPQILETLLEII